MPGENDNAAVGADNGEQLRALREDLQKLEKDLEEEPFGNTRLEMGLRATELRNEIANIEALDTGSLDQGNIRKSAREKKPTEKAQENLEAQKNKLFTKFEKSYEKWKVIVKGNKAILVGYTTPDDLNGVVLNTTKHCEATGRIYENLRKVVTPSVEIRRKMDTCVSISTKVITAAEGRLANVGAEEFDDDEARRIRRHLRVSDEGDSIFSSVKSKSFKSKSVKSRGSRASVEVATREAELKALEEENKKRDELEEMVRSNQKKKAEQDAQALLRDTEYAKMKRELDRLEAENKVNIAKVKAEAELEEDVFSDDLSSAKSFKSEKSRASARSGSHAHHSSVRSGNHVHRSSSQSGSLQQGSSSHDTANLVKALTTSMSLSRLPVPEPSVFDGNSLEYNDWKMSFQVLIEGKEIPVTDRLFYLRKYVGSKVKPALEGHFLTNSEAGYKEAWKLLDERYGDPFMVAEAFREKLHSWQKIGQKDSKGLQAFTDFLRSCEAAMSQISELEILNDSHENRRILQKLPEWLTSRWNRKVEEIREASRRFPRFDVFVRFIVKESRISSNPITSLNALKKDDQENFPKKGKSVNTHVTSGQSESMSFATSSKSPAKSPAKNVSTKSVESKHAQPAQQVQPPQVKYPCLYCKSEACYLPKCKAFGQKSMDDKKQFIIENHLCFGCLKKGHSSKECRRRSYCDTCNRRHPTVLHNPEWNYSESKPESQKSSAPFKSEEVKAVSHRIERTNTSMITPVWLSTVTNPSEEILVYALLDTQSDTTFVLEDAVKRLEVQQHPVNLKLTTLTAKDLNVQSNRVEGLQVRGLNSAAVIPLPSSYTRECIPVDRSQIPTRQTARKWKHLECIAEELPPIQSCDVGLLIGYNCPQALIPRDVVTGNFNEPFAQRTDLGWTVVGSTNPCLDQENVQGMSHRVTSMEMAPTIAKDVLKLLESDFKDVEVDKTVSQDDIEFIRIQDEGVHQLEDSHYEMPLPFRKGNPDLPNNKALAVIRLNHLKRKFTRDKKYHEDYVAFMKQVINSGDAEKAPEVLDNETVVWYIPHHGVYHPKKKKMRVVFDCSAKFRGVALNDKLLTGPDLTNALVGVLCRFRKESYAFMCDIEKMFHQFKVNQEHRDYLRFLWWEDGEFQNDPIEYRMNVHLFGASSSPGCANYGLKTIAREQSSESQQQAAQFIMRNLYVDDGLISVSSVEEGKRLVKDAQDVCRKGGLRLHKFVSNNEELIQSIPESERAPNMTNFDLTFDNAAERVLGIQWLVKSDKFNFTFIPQEQPSSRRGVLSIVASLYDPLGFVSPFTLIGKSILQEMCRRKLGWDDVIPGDLQPRWESWKQELENLKDIHIPRCYHPASFGQIIRVELHNFSDASNYGYGQCTYLRLTDDMGEVHCSLVMAKSRVAPTKVVTIPRLELSAALVSVKVSRLLKEELEYGDIEEFYWTDSKVVLGYINNEARRFHVFVANRVEQIRQGSNPEQWSYVPTAQNPADYASRGLNPQELEDTCWFSGPQFLWDKNFQFEANVEDKPNLVMGDPEVKSSVVFKVQAGDTILSRLNGFSRWSDAVRAIARLRRRVKGIKSTDLTTVEERKDATMFIVKLAQRNSFQEVIDCLSKGDMLKGSENLLSLNPYLDKEGVLRVGGRLSRSSLEFEIKHPCILTKDQHVSRLIISHFHDKVHHQGRGMTINEIRSNGFWIVNCGKGVAEYIHKCIRCRKLRRQPEHQMMADLPEDRLDTSPPFLSCGMDCFGPFYVRDGRKELKRYGLIFTCLTSRAVHIESLDDMSTDCFINAFRCFLSIRGPVKLVRSDQGTNFIGARNEFKAELDRMEPTLKSFLSEQDCDFVLNPPSASHMGGVWERQIRTIRNILTSLLNEYPGRLDSSSFRTFLYEAMTTVNSRPLTTTSDTNDIPLTPNHLLTMKSKTLLPPPGEFVREDVYARKRWRRVQFLSNQFWSRWKKEYVTNLNRRQKWLTPKRNMKKGDVVLLAEDDVPRNAWSLGKVVEAFESKDGLVRKVNIIKSGSTTTYSRPIHKLVLLIEAA